MSDPHSSPYGDGTQPNQPPSYGSYPPPASGGNYPPPQSGGGYPPPASGGSYPPYGETGQTPPPGTPGYDPNAAQPGMAPPVGPVSDQPSAKRKPWKIIAIVVGVLLLLCCVGGAVLVANSGKLFSTAAADAKVGDCLSGKKIDQSSDKFQKADLKVVKCSDPDALYKVVGRVEDRTQSQAQTDDNVCGAFADATNLYWQGREGEKGTVLCMKENK